MDNKTKIHISSFRKNKIKNINRYYYNHSQTKLKKNTNYLVRFCLKKIRCISLGYTIDPSALLIQQATPNCSKVNLDASIKDIRAQRFKNYKSNTKFDINQIFLKTLNLSGYKS